MTSLRTRRSRSLGAAFATALILGGTSLAQCPADDAPTTNNDCASAVPGSIGATVAGLSVQDVTEDWWTYLVPGESDLSITASLVSGGSVELELYSDANLCSDEVDSTVFLPNADTVSWSNLSPAPVVVTLRVFLSSGTCADYALTATLSTTNLACPAILPDSEEQNDSCLAAISPSANPLPGLNVSKLNEDWFFYAVGPGQILTVDAIHVASEGDIDLEILRRSNCASFLANAETRTDNETVVWTNTSSNAVDVAVRVHLWAGDDVDCNPDYSLVSSLLDDPCLTGSDDSLEENDTCSTAAIGPAAATGLFVSQTDEDFYSYTVQHGEILDVKVLYEVMNGEINAQLIDASDCATVLDSSATNTLDNENLTYSNWTGGARNVVVRVFVAANSVGGTCNTYDLAATALLDPCFSTPDDSFEENDDCMSASPVPTGTQVGLLARREGVDEDWFSIDVPDGESLVVTASFLNADGDIDIELFEACSGVLASTSASTVNMERLVWTNETGGTVNAKWNVYIWFGDMMNICNTYDMEVEIISPLTPISFCFGDGSGTACPCSNNSMTGHPGGCANSAGDGAILSMSGDAILGANTIGFGLSSAAPNLFALLVSGLNPLPQVGGCTACGLMAFDGLRCAGGDLIRHGVLPIDANGDSVSNWGSQPNGSGALFNDRSFMAGQSRSFFVFYRDEPGLVCGTGQNSSNGIQVTFQ